MRFARVLLASLLVVSVSTGFAAAPAFARGKPVSGPNLRPELVVPGPGDEGASGSFTYSAGRSGFTFRISVSNLDGLINTIYLYRGDAGTSGPSVVRLSPSPIGINQLLGTVPISNELEREISRYPERFYIQVNTTTHPGGALRGQLR
jgi:hypothetical protein